MVAKVDPSLEPITLHLWTVEEYERLIELGILTEYDRVELIEGQIVEVAPIGVEHAYWVDALSHAAEERSEGRGITRVQSPVRLFPDSEPEPDVVVLHGPRSRYRHRHPERGDILLVIEVADSSLTYDRTVKALMYARREVPELWVWDIPHEVVHVCRDPGPEGYQTVRVAGRDEVLEPVALPGLKITFAELS